MNRDVSKDMNWNRHDVCTGLTKIQEQTVYSTLYSIASFAVVKMILATYDAFCCSCSCVNPLTPAVWRVQCYWAPECQRLKMVG